MTTESTSGLWSPANCDVIIFNDEAWGKSIQRHFRRFKWLYLKTVRQEGHMLLPPAPAVFIACKQVRHVDSAPRYESMCSNPGRNLQPWVPIIFTVAGWRIVLGALRSGLWPGRRRGGRHEAAGPGAALRPLSERPRQPSPG
jgi:hypothetical protein